MRCNDLHIWLLSFFQLSPTLSSYFSFWEGKGMMFYLTIYKTKSKKETL